MKTLIYGGTFDPPHIGHTAALKTACGVLKPDRVLVIPSAMPPHKATETDFPDSAARIEMTRIAMSGIPDAEICDIEAVRGGKSYTVDTLTALCQRCPGENFTLLMGTDMISCFETWKDFEKILSMAELGVLIRAEGEREKALCAAESLREKYGARVSYIAHEPIDVSSTEIRSLLPERRGMEYLDGGVYSYIVKNRLYGAKPDFAWLREKAHAMLKPSRVPHVLGTEEEAVRLAERWGVDTERAREAAICHDITKKEDLEAQLILCEKYGIMADGDERKNYKLLHSKTGAAVARDEFGVDDAVYDAIFWHTTGRENMTPLEKVIYLADYIEPTRDFDGLAELRRIAYEDLDAAVLLGLKMSIEDITSGGVVPHGRTLEAARWLEACVEDKRK